MLGSENKGSNTPRHLQSANLRNLKKQMKEFKGLRQEPTAAQNPDNSRVLKPLVVSK